MSFKIGLYNTLIFDCDGVILNSNRVKTDAFYQAALPYGEAAAQALVDYHVGKGGVSRYLKFSHFLEHIVPEYAAGRSGPSLDELLEHYASAALEGLLTCEVAPGLQQLREDTPNARWLIVSGGDQAELRHVFAKRGLAELFDAGIYGSPDTKDEILTRKLQNNTIQTPALFLGDSKYDHQAARAAGLDFVFLNEWSEVQDWREWTGAEGIRVEENMSGLLKTPVLCCE